MTLVQSWLTGSVSGLCDSPSVWITAVFGLVGTLTGASITWLGQRALLNRQERQSHLGLQQSAASAFVAATDLFIAEADSLRYSITADQIPEDLVQAGYARYYDAWAAFVQSRGPLTLSAPQPVLDAGGQVLVAFDRLVRSTDHVFMKRKMPSGELGWWPRFEEAKAVRDTFVDVARKELGTVRSLTAEATGR